MFFYLNYFISTFTQCHRHLYVSETEWYCYDRIRFTSATTAVVVY